MRAYSPNCIMMLPAYARRVTIDESETRRKYECSLHRVAEYSKHISVH